MGKYQASKEIRDNFLKPIEEAAYKNGVSINDFFRDWIMASAYASSGTLMAMAGEVEEGKRRIKYCDEITTKYSKECIEVFLLLSKNLQEELTREPRDVLGEIYQGIQANKSSLGQVFTPIYITEMMATMLLTEAEMPINLSDPCCGSGAMTIGYYRAVTKQGLTREDFNSFGQDIDHFCCMMAFLQLELLGISAHIYNDDALAHPYGYENCEIEKIYVTTQYLINSSGKQNDKIA